MPIVQIDCVSLRNTYGSKNEIQIIVAIKVSQIMSSGVVIPIKYGLIHERIVVVLQVDFSTNNYIQTPS